MKNRRLARATWIGIMTALALPAFHGGLAASPDLVVRPDWAPDALDLHRQFRNYEVQVLSPDAVLAAALTGSVRLGLLDQVFEVTVEPAPWEGRTTILAPDEGALAHPPGFYARLFVGRVAGAPDSRALFTITPGGVDGYVRSGDHWIQFEPLAQFARGSSTALVVVYRTLDAVIDSKFEEDALPAIPDDLPAAPTGGPGVDSAAERELGVWGDFEFTQLYPDPCGAGYCPWDKVHDVINRVQDNFDQSVGFTFSLFIHSQCLTEECNENIHATSSDATTLLSQWADELLSKRNRGVYPREISHLLTGKDLNGATIGVAYRPGRYSLGMMRNDNRYEPQGSDANANFEASVVTSHELGHSFNGHHARATSRNHDHVAQHCHLFFIICWQNHEHVQHTTHWTLMAAEPIHEPEQDLEMDNWFSTGAGDNEERVRNCNNGNWANLGYAPAAGLAAGDACMIGA